MDNEYGTCCVCEKKIEGVANLIALDYKTNATSGWGCLKCGLPMEGAVAVICDGCFDKVDENGEDKIKFIMNGIEERIPVPPVHDRIPHEHDLSLHPEHRDEEDDENTI